jgi:hypothetical protein
MRYKADIEKDVELNYTSFSYMIQEKLSQTLFFSLINHRLIKKSLTCPESHHIFCVFPWVCCFRPDSTDPSRLTP